MLALVTSDWFFEEVVRHSPAARPTAYRRVRVRVKETDTVGWVHLPDHPYPSRDIILKDPLLGGLATAVPHQLPADMAHFVGRVEELDQLSTLLDTVTEDGGTVISAVSGTAGVGKTALALRWAHRVRDEFPDGQLYMDLRGYDPDQPLSPGHALAGFLRALGVAGAEIPPEVDERAAAYRSLLDRRRILVVLDNAHPGYPDRQPLRAGQRPQRSRPHPLRRWRARPSPPPLARCPGPLHRPRCPRSRRRPPDRTRPTDRRRQRGLTGKDV